MLAEFAGPAYPLDAVQASTLHLPCLVVKGTTSHPALQSIADTLAAAIPGARLTALDGAGHVTYAERPDQFAAAVAGFADAVYAPRRDTAA
jgi:pimeloyl-ACP methyl ester carboxylesterase